MSYFIVAEVVPLKQGLKPLLPTNKTHSKFLKVAEVVPLKQGLKPDFNIKFHFLHLRCRGSSIKTRIETLL